VFKLNEGADGVSIAICAQKHRVQASICLHRLIHSLRSLLDDLATLARYTIITAITPHYPLTVLTRPTPIQQKAFDLLGVGCGQ
jgi:hypothetical protein